MLIASLPEAEQDAIFERLLHALHHRGRDGYEGEALRLPPHAVDDVKKIGDILARNGCEIEEYT
jgi:hypothetical protein